jgi:hypothetical protein
MSRRSPIHLGEIWKHRVLGDQGTVTGMCLFQIEIDGEVESRWLVEIAVAMRGETTTQRWEENLFLHTHAFISEKTPSQRKAKA